MTQGLRQILNSLLYRVNFIFLFLVMHRLPCLFSSNLAYVTQGYIRRLRKYLPFVHYAVT